MEIIVGKQSGFCFGVKNVVDKVNEELENNGNDILYCLGELVHNKNVVGKFEEKGLKIVQSLSEAKNKVIIRAHGVEKKVYEEAKKRNIELIDLTCPKVSTIHNIVEEYEKKGFFIILIGDKNHPEVIGTYSFAKDENICKVESEDDFKEVYLKIKNSNKKNVLIIAQTTFNLQKFIDFSNALYEKLRTNYNVVINNTICKSTELRQKETEEIAKNVDIMLIIGGKNSSNTKKLYDVASKYCINCIFIENPNDVQKEEIVNIIKHEKIGIVAGASTSQEDILELVDILNNNCCAII